MARGGPRPSAGRPKGVRNKKTVEQVKAVAESGITPLDFLLDVMRDEKEDAGRRIDAAKAAAQYVHPKLSAIEAKVQAELTYEERLRRLAGE